MFDIPILLVAWRRPIHLRKVIDSMRTIEPRIIYAAVDGPRDESEFIEDSQLIAETQKIILNEIDWDCKVYTLFRDRNLGCGNSVQSALDWFFQNEKMGIILEDDILPSRFFFTFMKENLLKYQNDARIFSINGNALGFAHRPYTSYGITPYFNMWGWGTWRRSNDLVHKIWYNQFSKGDTFSDAHLAAFDLPFPWRRKRWRQHWKHIFERTAIGMVNTWDYQWVYTCIASGSVCIRPNQNLTKNIGYDGSGTHTFNALQGKYLNKTILPDGIGRGVLHPKKATTNCKYEVYHVAELWNGITLNPFKIAYSFLRRSIKKIIVFLMSLS